MSDPHPVYRSLVRLYPRTFRSHYRDDLVQHFGDLVADRGAPEAWTRTGIDLIVTIPRYRLESMMSEQRSTTTLTAAIALLAGGGVLSMLAGLYAGLVLLVAAVVLGVSQRSALARAIRTSDSSRRRRLGIAAVLGLVALAAIVSYSQAISDDHISGASLVAHNAIGVPAMVGAIGFLLIGLRTPKASGNRRPVP